MKKHCYICEPNECDCTIDAKRTRVKYRGENLYISHGIKNGKSHEIMLSACDQNKAEQQITLSGLDLVGKLISTLLKLGEHEKVEKILRTTSRSKNDLAGIIHKIITGK